eukprot:2601496-Rhodomonas_salina.3
MTGAKSAIRLRTHWLNSEPLREPRMEIAVKKVSRPTISPAFASPWRTANTYPSPRDQCPDYTMVRCQALSCQYFEFAYLRQCL